MATPCLALNPFDGVTPQAKRYVNVSAANVGVTFGALEVGRDAITFSPKRVIQFGGPDTWLAVVGNQIYRTTDAGASWTSVATLTSIATNTAFKSGLHVVYNNGVPRVCCVYTTSNSWSTSVGASSLDGVSWVLHGSFVTPLSTTSLRPSAELVYRNALWFFCGAPSASSFAFVYNPAVGTVATLLLAVGTESFAACVFNGRLFVGGRVGTDVRLYEVTASGTVLVQSVGTASAAAGLRFELFVSGDYMYFVWAASTAPAWRVQRYDANLNPTTITPADCLPAVMTGFTPTSNPSNLQRYVDHEAVIGNADPAIYLYFAANNALGTAMTMFQWLGEAMVMANVDSGGNVGHALGITTGTDGGEYAYTSGERAIEVLSKTPVLGGERLTFRLYSQTGTDVVSVRGWCSGDLVEYPDVSMIFADPSVGTLSAGDTVIDGLTADNSTSYQVTWLAGSTGNNFANGQRVKSKLEIYS